MAEIGGDKIEQDSISVYGLHGSFSKLLPGDQNVRVRYFSTKVSMASESDVGNGRSLLEKLKPMREIVTPSELKDLNSILQRDLNDMRVSTELVPYLLGHRSPIAFFPPVVVALIPKGFLGSEVSPDYPRPSESEPDKTDYARYWSLSRFTVAGQMSALGKLQVYTKETDLIVLDGQHRANAFRFLSGDFAESSGNEIYSVFYSELNQSEKQELSLEEVELPVTLIWFESQVEVNPLMISRRLFVDVNNNAKTVNESRRILLDDSSAINAATTAFYELIAERGFSTESFSLLHAGYDADNDPNTQRERTSALTLFTPVMLRDAMSFFLFGTPKSTDIAEQYTNYVVGMMTKEERLFELAPDIDSTVYAELSQGIGSASRSFKDALQIEVIPAILTAIDGYPLYKKHVEASDETDRWVRENLNHPTPMTWNKVFKGGEGLYYSFADLRSRSANDNTLTAAQKNYLKAIQDIEDAQSVSLHGLCPGTERQVATAFRTIRTKAFLIGYLMSFAVYSRSVGSVNVATAEKFVKLIGSVGADRWILALSDLKQAIAPSLDPKFWWLLRNIMLRMIDEEEDGPTFFKSDNPKALKASPEYIFVQRWITDRIKNYKEDVGDSAGAPDDDAISSWKEKCDSSLSSLMGRIGLSLKIGGLENDDSRICVSSIIDETISASFALNP